MKDKYVNREEKLQFDEFYHIYNRAIGSDKLFITEKDYDYFLKKIERFIIPVADLFAYCLIPNHFHLLVRIKSEDNILKVSTCKGNASPLSFVRRSFSNFLNSYSKSYNLAHQRLGRLFLYPYKRILVENEDYLISLITYIHRNPIHHGLTKDYDTWLYSSYKNIISNQLSLIKKEEVLALFDSVDDFVTHHQENIVKPDFRKYLQEFD